MITKNDIEVTASFGSWPQDEVISTHGYKPSRMEQALKISVRNKSSERIEWWRVDVGVHHDETQVRRTTGPNVDRMYTETKRWHGTEVLTYGSGVLGVGKSITMFEQSKSAYQHVSKGRHWKALRIYGQTLSGKFLVHLDDPSSPPLRVDVALKMDACFIATAAFAHERHPTVTELRRVRDELLLPTSAGRAFVKFYYRHSPRIAKWMADRPRVKRAARAILTPLARSTRALSSVRRDGWRSLFQNKL